MISYSKILIGVNIYEIVYKNYKKYFLQIKIMIDRLYELVNFFKAEALYFN